VNARGQEILEWLRETLRALDLAPADASIDEHTGLLGQGVGLDSVEALQLVTAIEERFGLTLEDDELTADRFRTVGSLIAYVREKLADRRKG
jgi:acyl carrier protein